REPEIANRAEIGIDAGLVAERAQLAARQQRQPDVDRGRILGAKPAGRARRAAAAGGAAAIDDSDPQAGAREVDRTARADHAGPDNDDIGMIPAANIARFGWPRYCPATSQSCAPCSGVAAQVTLYEPAAETFLTATA